MKRALLSSVVFAVAASGLEAQGPDQGIALYREGKYAEAEPVLRGASGLEAKAYLAATLARLKKLEEAEAQAKAVLAEAQPPGAVARSANPSWGSRSWMGRRAARPPEGAAICLRALLAGQAFQLKKQVARMVEDYQSFLKLAPEAPEAPALKVLLAGLR
jgi:hypothetical protein